MVGLRGRYISTIYCNISNHIIVIIHSPILRIIKTPKSQPSRRSCTLKISQAQTNADLVRACGNHDLNHDFIFISSSSSLHRTLCFAPKSFASMLPSVRKNFSPNTLSTQPWQKADRTWIHFSFFTHDTYRYISTIMTISINDWTVLNCIALQWFPVNEPISHHEVNFIQRRHIWPG